MNYGEVLEKSWKIIWKHKILWLFGLLASCGRASGGGGGGGGGGNVSSGQIPDMTFQDMPPWIENLTQTFVRMAENGTILWLVAGLFVFGFLLAIIALALNAMGRAGLVRGAWQADAGEDKLAFGALWQDGLRYFWRVAGLILLFAVGTGLLFMVLLGPVIILALVTLGIGLLCLIPFICLLIPVGIGIGVLEELAVAAVVGEDTDIFEGIRRAWQIVRTRLGEVVVMALILIIGGGIVRVLISLPALLIVAPIVIGVLSGTQGAIMGGFIVTGALLLIYLPIAILLSSALQAYLGSAWALTYRRLTGKDLEAPVETLFPQTPPQGEMPVIE
ncbi:MAG: hypothetical protein IT308_01795 [Anaerolineaceae bacterium]|nr:hypothetical protein [Anaerolineaceae bacterium]